MSPKINIHEVESLLQFATAEFCNFGASELDRERHLAEWRSRIGYCKKHLDIIKKGQSTMVKTRQNTKRNDMIKTLLKALPCLHNWTRWADEIDEPYQYRRCERCGKADRRIKSVIFFPAWGTVLVGEEIFTIKDLTSRLNRVVAAAEFLKIDVKRSKDSGENLVELVEQAVENIKNVARGETKTGQ